jgi:ATP-dependent DNA ligase
VNHLKVRSCLIDGEVVCCDERGLATFQSAPAERAPGIPVCLKATLASILRKSRHGVRLNEHLEHDCGLTVFQHACKMGLEGIVSKRLGSRYRSGRSPEVQEPERASGPP